MSGNNLGRYIEVKDQEKIYLYSWENIDEVKGVVQIFHGMAEHAGRYQEVAELLNSRGYVVFADDHRGHGLTANDINKLGYIGEDGFNRIVEDEYFIMKSIKEQYPDVPLYVLGHSFGSFVAQEFFLRYGYEFQGLILCGSAAAKGIEVIGGQILSGYEMKKIGEKIPSERIDRISFGGYNKRIVDANSKFAWLSRDKEEVKKYDEDSYCGAVFTVGFFYYLFRAFGGFYRKERLSALNKDIPLYIIAGDADPVGKYGKSVKKLHSIYSKYGVKDITLRLYEGARHELFKEINKDEVFSDLIEWIDKIKK